MKKVLVLMFVAFFGMGIGVAQASIVLSGATPADSFVDLGAQGFGNAPRLLTLQNTGSQTSESGQILPTSPVTAAGYPTLTDTNMVPSPIDSAKNSAPTLSSLSWTSGADVEIGLNIGEPSSSTGITLTGLTLFVYNDSNTTPVGHFDLSTSLYPNGVFFDNAAIKLQQGNGNAIFDFVLTPAEQLQFNTLIAPLTDPRIALGASLTGTADGPDSFVAVPGSTPVPIPAAVWLLGSGMLGLIGIRRRFWK